MKNKFDFFLSLVKYEGKNSKSLKSPIQSLVAQKYS